MKSFIKKYQLVFWLIAGATLVYFTFKDLDLVKIWTSLKRVDIKWLAIVLIVSFITHLFRALRWKIMLHALGHQVSVFSSFTNMMFGYFVNNALPRGGEFSRCISLNKTDEVPFNASFGTVLVERLFDTVCLAILVTITLMTQYNELSGFLAVNVGIPIKVFVLKHKTKFIAGAVILLAMLFWPEKKKEVKIEDNENSENSDKPVSKIEELNQKLDNMQSEMWEGLKALIKMKDLPMFLVYTLLIWVGYYFMSQLWFYSLPEFAHLGWKAALMLMVVGTIGRSVPLPGGGMGAYHSLVAEALLIYGLTKEQGTVMAVLIHETQLIYVLVIGGLCYIPILLANKKKKEAQ